MAQCRGDPAAEYSRKLEYLKREEELIKEEEMEAEALVQPSGQALQVGHYFSFSSLSDLEESPLHRSTQPEDIFAESHGPGGLTQ